MSTPASRESTLIAHYKLLEHIGIGGLGDVYRARDTKLGRTVAIKVPPSPFAADSHVRDELISHGKAVSRLSHPSIAALFDIGEDHDRVYLAFEYVPGDYLSATIAGRPLNPRRAIEFGIQLADALADAHAEDLIHGDIHADSILVTPKDRVKLLDFGFARRLSTESDAQSLNASDDIRAVGRVLFEMLTGRPIPSTSPESMPLASKLAPGVPREIDPIIARALAADSAAGYQTAATMAAELRGAAAILDIRMTANEAESAARKLGIVSRVPWALASVALIAALVAGIWIWEGAARRLWQTWFGPPPSPILVVAPFAVDGVSTTMADGIAEDIAMRLGTISGLRVVGRSSLRSSRGVAPAEIARKSGAAVTLTGTIRGDGDQVTLDAAMIDAATDAVVWRKRFVSAKAQLLETEASVMEDVAAAVGLASTGAEYERTAARTVTPAAYELYFQARDADSRDDLITAIRLYEEATTADSSLAECHAALAMALYRELQRQRPRDDRDFRQRIRQAADNAVAADPDWPAAHLAMGLAGLTSREAFPAFSRAIQLDPSAGAGYQQLADQIAGFEPDRAAALHRAISERAAKAVTAEAAQPASR